MATEIKMPQLSDTMHAGKILSWNKQEGASVKVGDILAEVETDKATLEIEAFKAGVLLKILTPSGQEAKVGEVICYIGEAGENLPTEAPAETEAPADPSPSQETTAQEEPLPSTPQPTPVPSSTGRTKASPLAKKIAQQGGVNISTLTGSGPGGRVVRKDVAAAIGRDAAAVGHNDQPVPPEPSAAVDPAPLATESGTLEPLSQMRSSIARRMRESVQQSPHFFCTMAIDMEGAVDLHAALKEDPDYRGISLNHFIIKAAAYALTKVPEINCAYRDGHIFRPAGVNIGIVTAVEQGLLIPVLHHTDALALKDLVFEARAAVERARAGRPSAQDLSGGTFTISNLGMLGVEHFTALINPGQGAILAVGAVRSVPVVRQQQVIPGKVMKVTLSADHRVIDGLAAGQFLQQLKRALEIPALLCL